MGKRTYTLSLMFDVDQVTKALHYHIGGPKGTPFKGEGRLAGTFHFNAGDEVSVCVKATSRERDKARFTITDFTLASIPTLPAGKYDLSLFDKHRASIRVNDWGIPEYGEDDSGEKSESTINALHPLLVTAVNGQWELSGYLSVLIEKMGQDGEMRQFPRLFYFDPESSSGSGGDISDDR